MRKAVVIIEGRDLDKVADAVGTLLDLGYTIRGFSSVLHVDSDGLTYQYCTTLMVREKELTTAAAPREATYL